MSCGSHVGDSDPAGRVGGCWREKRFSFAISANLRFTSGLILFFKVERLNHTLKREVTVPARAWRVPRGSPCSPGGVVF